MNHEFEVDTDSQSTMDDNPHISDNLDINTSENQPDKNLSNEILMTVAYVKNESTSNTLSYDALNSKANEDCHERNVIEISVMKTEKKEGYTDSASGNVTNDEYTKMQAKETSQENRIKGHVINHMADISQHDKIGDSDTVDMEDVCSSSATQAKAKTQKYTHQRLHTGERRFMCDLCTYSARKVTDLKRHKLVHSGEKHYKCVECSYSTRKFAHLKTHKLVHSGEKPFTCNLCDYGTTTSVSLKRHETVHSGVKPYKCDVCNFSTTTSGHLNTHKRLKL